MTGTPTTEAGWARVQRFGKYSGPRYTTDKPPRKQWGLEPREVAKLLDDPNVAEARSIGEASIYRRFAGGNDSFSTLADEFANGNEFGFLVYVHNLEANILRDAAGFNLIGPGKVNPANITPRILIEPEAPIPAGLEPDTVEELAEFVDSTAADAALTDKGMVKAINRGNFGASIHNEPER